MEPVFDVPALLSQDIDHVQKMLGPLEQEGPSRFNPEENVKQFRRDTTTLAVAYHTRTRKVLSFFIRTNHGQTRNYNTLLKLVNLQKDEPAVVVVPLLVPTKPGLYSGVKVFLKDGAF